LNSGKNWRIIPFRKFNAFENMAIDEAIFRGCQQGTSHPTLRLYGWQPPAVSLGYFQNLESEINISFCRTHKIDIVRRPTGGKAVFHEKDLTYSLTARESDPPFSTGILGTYLIISRCILDALSGVGVVAEVEEEGRSPRGNELLSQCFSSSSRYELLVNKRKICGSAQVRTNGAFLQHGSLLLDFDPSKALSVVSKTKVSPEQTSSLEDSVTSLKDHVSPPVDPGHLSQLMAKSFEDILQVKFTTGWLTKEEETLKNRLLKDKYKTDRWNRTGRMLRHLY